MLRIQTNERLEVDRHYRGSQVGVDEHPSWVTEALVSPTPVSAVYMESESESGGEKVPVIASAMTCSVESLAAPLPTS